MMVGHMLRGGHIGGQVVTRGSHRGSGGHKGEGGSCYSTRGHMTSHDM